VGVEAFNVQLSDGARTTVHVAYHHLDRTRLRVVRLRRPAPLAAWCAAHGVRDALTGGFYDLGTHAPLGELRTRSMLRAHQGFDAPWNDVRACLHVHRGQVRMARRDELPRGPRGDLLQAGPLLVSGGQAVHVDGLDPEGFSAGAHQFMSDITAQRHPRAALARAGRELIAVATDGRAAGEAGMTLEELAGVLVNLGADEALNLDGGGSTSLVRDGRLRNAPREPDGAAIPGGRALTTALTFTPRAAPVSLALPRPRRVA
jgi:phosphodiester glycosidase